MGNVIPSIVLMDGITAQELFASVVEETAGVNSVMVKEDAMRYVITDYCKII